MAEISCNSVSIGMISTGVIAHLEAMMTKNLVEDRHIRKIIMAVEMNVKKAVQRAILNEMDNNRTYPRIKSTRVHYHHIEKSVKMSIYKKILGANVSLYNNKRARRSPVSMPYQGRYNPRRYRCKSTIDQQEGNGWWPDEIERFVNNGTAFRKTGYKQNYYMGRNTSESRNYATPDRFGNRKSKWAVSWSTGRIGGLHFFDVAHVKQKWAAEELAKRINRLLGDIIVEYEKENPDRWW